MKVKVQYEMQLAVWCRKYCKVDFLFTHIHILHIQMVHNCVTLTFYLLAS